MGKSTISMAIFNSYVKLPEGIDYRFCILNPKWLTATSHFPGGLPRPATWRKTTDRKRNGQAATGADRGQHPFGLGIVSRKKWEFHGISLLYRAVPVGNYILNIT